ncbi:MAG TPA: histidine phosphatase family protein [Methylophilaceae bacterium]|nr:histidine phosphatase family protein [Methylophilaceae bacterium]
MELILWRHAEAEDSYPDMDRVLTSKGLLQAKKMGAWLRQYMPRNTRILVSPATRTQQTANALELPFTTLESLAPGASPQLILEEAQWATANDAALIIGHQPTLGMAAAFAMTHKPHYWCIKKGAVWWIASRVRGHEEQSIIRAVVSPDFV